MHTQCMPLILSYTSCITRCSAPLHSIRTNQHNANPDDNVCQQAVSSPAINAPTTLSSRNMTNDGAARDYAGALARALPTEKTAEQKERRMAMFDHFDPNGNGYLSLAEVDKGLHETFGLEGVYNCKPAIIRAFNAAKGLKKGGSGRDDDYVTKVEFRMLLVYLKQYFELFQIFDGIDTGADRRIDAGEFVRAADKLRAWGMEVADDPEATFDEIDADGGGQILFIEFCEWAMARNLLAHVHEDHVVSRSRDEVASRQDASSDAKDCQNMSVQFCVVDKVSLVAVVLCSFCRALAAAHTDDGWVVHRLVMCWLCVASCRVLPWCRVLLGVSCCRATYKLICRCGIRARTVAIPTHGRFLCMSRQ